MPEPDLPPRLNILALPSQTTVLFTLIFLVIGVPLLLSTVGVSVPCGPALVVATVALTLHDFLTGPDRHIRRHAMKPLPERFDALKSHLSALIETHASKGRPPGLLLSTDPGVAIHSFGTFNRRYVVISEQLADELQKALSSRDEKQRRRAEAVLLHELAHFANGDVWKVHLSRSLLKVTVLYMTVSWLATLVLPLMYHYAARFFITADVKAIVEPMRFIDPQTVDAILELPPIVSEAVLRYEIYSLNAHWPMIVGSLLLLVFFWRRLLRVREMYADARVAAWQGSDQFLLSATQWMASLVAFQPRASRRRLVPRLAFPSGSANGLSRLLSVQPSQTQRRDVLRQPHRIYGSPLSIALVAGITVVLLNLTTGTLLASRFVRSPNSVVPLSVGFAVLAVSMLPYLLTWRGPRAQLLNPLGQTVLLFSAIKLVPQTLFSVPLAVFVILNPTIVDSAAYTLVLAGGESLPALDVPLSYVIDMLFIRPWLFFVLFMPSITLLAMLLDTVLKQRILTWYSAPWIQRRPALALWSVSFVLVTVLALGILPLAEALVFPIPHPLLEPVRVAGFGTSFLMMLTTALTYHHWDRRYAHVCPGCNANVPGDFYLGRCCSVCGEMLHPHLLQTAQGAASCPAPPSPGPTSGVPGTLSGQDSM